MSAKKISEIDPSFDLFYLSKDGSVNTIQRANADLDTTMKESLRKGRANTDIEAIFIVHGFQNDITAEWMHDMKDGILKAVPTSFVFIVGWGKGAQTVNYLKAAGNTQVVGAWLAGHINFLKKNYEGTILGIRCVGHSLGAHLVGSAGVSSEIDRIDALDPAGPAFATPPLTDLSMGRLSPKMARFVQVIHTDGFHEGPSPSLGTVVPMGHVDFYPNFGGDQGGTLHADVMHSHAMAYTYYTRSILSDSIFKADWVLDEVPKEAPPSKSVSRASAMAQMGFWCSTNANGLYYLDPWDMLNLNSREVANSLSKIDPKLHLYYNAEEVRDVHSDFRKIVTSEFQRSKIATDEPFQTVFIVYGFMYNSYTEWVQRLKQAILTHAKNTFVFILEWGDMKNYPEAVANAKVVGEWFRPYISTLRTLYSDNVYIRCVGHGLGAHLICFAAESTLIDRIDALDPAGPLFETRNRGLNRSDAKFVQVIHTDGYCKSGGIARGTLRPMGHIDFYVNDGMNQPGALVKDVDHSHAMAHEYYIATIPSEYRPTVTASYVLAKEPSACVAPANLVVKAKNSATMPAGMAL